MGHIHTGGGAGSLFDSILTGRMGGPGGSDGFRSGRVGGASLFEDITATSNCPLCGKLRWTALSVEESSLPGRSKNTLPRAWLSLERFLCGRTILARKTLLFVGQLNYSLDGGSSD